MSSRAVTSMLMLCFCLTVGNALSIPAKWQAQGLRDVPQRCVDSSVTAVSCADADEDSLLPHPDDCELFYYCVSGELAPVCRQCPAGLHFSPTEHVCAAPAVAGCRHTPGPVDPQPTSTPGASTTREPDEPITSQEPATTQELSTTQELTATREPTSTQEPTSKPDPNTTIFEPVRPTAIDPNIPNTTIFESALAMRQL